MALDVFDESSQWETQGLLREKNMQNPQGPGPPDLAQLMLGRHVIPVPADSQFYFETGAH